MAEAFLKDYFIKASSEIEVISAGINVKKDFGATDKAIKAMENFNIDMSNHTTRLLDHNVVENAELIIAMPAGDMGKQN